MPTTTNPLWNRALASLMPLTGRAALEVRGAQATIITDRPQLIGDHPILRTPRGLEEWLTLLVAVVPGQVYALRQANLRGRDVDQPVGLAKITSTS